MSRSKQPQKPRRTAQEKAARAKALTPKQKRFCEEYLIDLNGTQAAIRAGYSKHTPNAIAFELLGKPEIQKEINALLAKQSKRTEITADRVLQEIATVAFAEIGSLETARDDGAKHRAKLKALEMLAKHLTLFTENINVNINPQKPLEEMTDDELAEYRASLMAITNRKGEA